jgi:cytochrome c biogenesis protein CcdA
VQGDGWHGQAAIGLLLGLVWAPCVGPTLGVAIAAASTGENLAASFITFLAFGIGVASSILVFAYGSRRALGERRKTLASLARYGKPLFGATLVVVGALVLSGLDKQFEAALLDLLPASLVAFTTSL